MIKMPNDLVETEKRPLWYWGPDLVPRFWVLHILVIFNMCSSCVAHLTHNSLFVCLDGLSLLLATSMELLFLIYRRAVRGTENRIVGYVAAVVLFVTVITQFFIFEDHYGTEELSIPFETQAVSLIIIHAFGLDAPDATDAQSFGATRLDVSHFFGLFLIIIALVIIAFCASGERTR